MSTPLIPLTIHGIPYPHYTVPMDALALNTNLAGAPASPGTVTAHITRTRGDHGPTPAPITFKIEIIGANQRHAYDNAYAALDHAKAASATLVRGRVTWYGGAFDLRDVTGYHIEPTSPEAVTLTLELLPAHEPTHYGVLLPTTPGAPRAEFWDANGLLTPLIINDLTNDSPALPRPRTSAATVPAPAGGIAYSYYPLRNVPGGFQHGAPYDPDQLEVFGLIRGRFTSTGISQRIGLHIMHVGPSTIQTIALMINNTAGFGRADFMDLNTGAVIPSDAGTWWTQGPVTANKWQAIRIRATRLSGNTYRYQGKAWAQGTGQEPTEWAREATVTTPGPPSFAGAAKDYPNTSAASITHLAHMAVAYSGAPAPTINP